MLLVTRPANEDLRQRIGVFPTPVGRLAKDDGERTAALQQHRGYAVPVDNTAPSGLWFDEFGMRLRSFPAEAAFRVIEELPVRHRPQEIAAPRLAHEEVVWMAVVFVITLIFTSVGCGTWKGMGEDVSGMGDSMQKSGE